MVGIVMFCCALFMLLIGFSVAFTFGATAVIFGFAYGIIEAIGYNEGLLEGFNIGKDMFSFMPYRIFSIMQNKILISVPLFILMGMILQKTRLAERLLESMASLFGGVRGGIAISTVVVGALLAATTGIVGASVIAMGAISLPVMIKYHYNKALGCGTIAASGTLGQIIPPSIVLIVLGDVFSVPVGDLFRAAVAPGLTLVAFYIVYIVIISFIKKDWAPPVRFETQEKKVVQIYKALKDIVPVLVLILLVLGSIFTGVATPTESSSVGCLGALLLAFLYRTFSFKLLKEALNETVKISAMVFTILMGATAFSMVFSYTGGDIIVEDFMLNLPGEKWGFIVLTMACILVLGFFIDYVEISYIILPILIPIAASLGIDPIWFAILIAVNLQTSFMTPPFGFSLFFLKGVTPPSVKTMDIYKGVVPFILIQIFVLVLVAFFPEVFGLSISK
ncbi:TRAP transporter large permease [Campylobacter geochelonis]|uniref:Trap dicarboxylate transporter, dctm subunit n=1 Tax=Campylobacter geochelonis TaxID=1780362 RepID=A0A128EDD8_9BACT|nr:TRAP transporter large permease subunit [Campylobacter geochelonis]QKF70904.1 TRAP transporter, large permease subunit [Campylobacter geochelonis]CZE46929.1 trap dicarboxylate transporter%2C dctm subunit [Campylobacter geochelonis]CZE49036.1 trap dicarboxylate transporter%2C dctm subunit [Campylobacter geochelonis]